METIVEPVERCTLLGSWAAVRYLAERDGHSTVPSVGVRTAFEGELSGRAAEGVEDGRAVKGGVTRHRPEAQPSAVTVTL